MADGLTYVEAVTLSIINVLALLGNTSLYYVVLKKPTMRTRTNWFILNLAAADLLVSVFNMPLTTYTILEGRWVLDERMCTVTGFSNILSFIASVMSLAMISIARYHKVVKWKSYSKYFTGRRCLIYIACVWFLSTSLAIPPLIGWARYSYIAGNSFCFVDWPSSISYTVFMIAICLFGPLITMIYCYWNIWKTTKESTATLTSHSRSGTLSKVEVSLNDIQANIRADQSLTGAKPDEKNGSGNPVLVRVSAFDQFENRSSFSDNEPESEYSTHASEVNKSASKSARKRLKALKARASHDMRLTRTLIIVVVVFAICWTPFAVTMVVKVILDKPIPRAVDFGTLLLGYANSACNVVIYVIMGKQFRQAFREAFGLRKLRDLCRKGES
ncbi:tyramine receptor Ser-2 [Nematostella vectensis]|nr:tyramine receptor Ser-2 [Nematostella vectensis]XP_032238119.2 tyramine receptor Ser-2 [Nematostella vectensis]XP_032238120.2 tyramine receptor Ser-2 [Nematostella vectensis]